MLGVLGVPLYPGGAIRRIYRYLSRLSIKKLVGLSVLSVLSMGVYYTKPPPYDFLNLYGACLQAPRTPKLK
jgi:hypothetical protein